VKKTKTQLLREALESRGFKPYEHVSRKACLRGPGPLGEEVYVWLDKSGGGRHHRSPHVTFAHAISGTTIGLLLEGKPSKVFGPVIRGEDR
jgi:hypothetical protein